MNEPKENGTPEATPEQLVKMLEMQMENRRSQRANSGRNRAIILVVGVLFIVGAAGAALLVLDQMLMDLRHSPGAPSPVVGEAKTNF